MTVTVRPAPAMHPAALTEIGRIVDTDLSIAQLYFQDAKTAAKWETRHTVEAGGTGPDDPQATYDVTLTIQSADDVGFGLDVNVDITGIAGSPKVAAQHTLLDRLKSAKWKISGETVLVNEFTFTIPCLQATTSAA